LLYLNAGSKNKQCEHLAFEHQKNLIIWYYGDHDLSMIVYNHTRPCHTRRNTRLRFNKHSAKTFNKYNKYNRLQQL